MKKHYTTPVAKYIEYEYDTQVVATSPGVCDNYTLVSKENPNTCFQYAKDIYQLYSLFPGCTQHDQE